MPDIQIKRGTTVSLGNIDGDLKAGRNVVVNSREGDLIVVSKGAYFEGDAQVNCNFECDSLSVKHGGKLKVKGNLTVHNLLDVLHTIDTSGFVKAQEIDVGGRIYAKSIECAGRVRVGGQLDVKDTVRGESIDVGGRAKIGGQVKLHDLNVGGVAEVGGGSILGKIRVGGKFESNADLEFGDMQVIGKILLRANCKGKLVSTYGRLSADGDLQCDEMEIKGRMDVAGDCKAEKIEASGKFSIDGSLNVSMELATWGQTEICEALSCADLRIGGKFKARRVEVGNEIELVGEAETTQGMKANTVLIRGGSRLAGPLVAKKVEIGRSYDVASNWRGSFAGQKAVFRVIGKETRVEDIYAAEIHLGRSSRCRRVYAEVVEFEEGCIAEEIVYSKEILGPIDKVYFNRPFPKRVTDLPKPPL